MGASSISGSSSAIADLTRLAVAAQQATKQSLQDPSVAAQALAQQNVQAVATGRLDTYA
jgi:hypothetical protein